MYASEQTARCQARQNGPMSDFAHLRKNSLLGALPQAVLSRWRPLLEPVDLELGQVLGESGRTMTHAYFPVDGIVSLLYVMDEGGESAEIAVVGCEGMVGISLFMGGGSTPSRAVVQNSGRGFRIKAEALREEFENSTAVSRLLLRYTQALIAQMTQTAACNRHHTLDQQFCRWLLLSLDRHSGNDLFMTQKLISNMLGVTAKKMTESARTLQDAGLIWYADGRVTVRDRPGLENCTCECYEVVRNEYKRLLA
jgi:CRP-like cAMP-binding protein